MSEQEIRQLEERLSQLRYQRIVDEIKNLLFNEPVIHLTVAITIQGKDLNRAFQYHDKQAIDICKIITEKEIKWKKN